MLPTKRTSSDRPPSPSSNPSPFPPIPLQQQAPIPSTSQVSSDSNIRPGDYAIDPSLMGVGVGLRSRDQIEGEFRGETPQQELGQAGAGRGREQNLFDADGDIVVGEASDANGGRSPTPQAQPTPSRHAALQEIRNLIDNLKNTETTSPDLTRLKNVIAGMTKWTTAAKRTFLLESKEDRKMSKENEAWKKDERNKQNGLGTRDFWVNTIKEQIQPALEENEGADQNDPSWHRVPNYGIFKLFEQNPKDPVSNFSVMLGELDRCEKPFWKLFAPSLSPTTLKMIIVRTRGACKKGLKLWLGCSTNQVIDMIPHMKTFIKEMIDQGAEVYTWSHLEHGKDKTDHPKDGIVACGKTGKVTWYQFSGNLGTAGMGHEVHWRDETERERKVREEILGLECEDEADDSEEKEDVEFPSSFENLGQVVFDARSNNSGLWELLKTHSRTYEIRREMKVLVMHTPGFFKRHMKIYTSDRPYDKTKYREQHRQTVKDMKKEQQAEALRDIGEISLYDRHRDSLEIAVFDAVQDEDEKAPAVLPFDDEVFKHAQSIASREDHVEARRILDKFERSLYEECNEDEEAATRRTELRKINNERKIDRKEVEEEEGFVKKNRVKNPNQPRNYASRMPRGRRPSSSNRSSSRPRAPSSNPTASRSGSASRGPGTQLQALNNGDYDTEILEILSGRDGLVAKWADVASRLSLNGVSRIQIKERYPHIPDAPPHPFSAYIDDFKRKLELARGATRTSGDGARGEAGEGVDEPTGNFQDESEREDEGEDDGEGIES